VLAVQAKLQFAAKLPMTVSILGSFYNIHIKLHDLAIK